MGFAAAIPMLGSIVVYAVAPKLSAESDIRKTCESNPVGSIFCFGMMGTLGVTFIAAAILVLCLTIAMIVSKCQEDCHVVRDQERYERIQLERAATAECVREAVN